MIFIVPEREQEGIPVQFTERKFSKIEKWSFSREKKPISSRFNAKSMKTLEDWPELSKSIAILIPLWAKNTKNQKMYKIFIKIVKIFALWNSEMSSTLAFECLLHVTESSAKISFQIKE